jgi:hypothetical protein
MFDSGKLTVTLELIPDIASETGKTEVPFHSRCGRIKIPLCSKALSAEQSA